MGPQLAWAAAHVVATHAPAASVPASGAPPQTFALPPPPQVSVPEQVPHCMVFPQPSP
jgi:hypothetical protein